MVTIAPRYDPGGDIGRAVGSGIGKGALDVTRRHRISGALDSITKGMDEKRAQGESINPLDVTMSMIKVLGPETGGMQMIGEIAPAIHKEVQRLNMSQPNQQKTSVPGSVNEGREGESSSDPTAGMNSSEAYESFFQEGMRKTLDAEKADAYAQNRLTAWSGEQNRRAQEQQVSDNLLNEKIGRDFPSGLSAPFENEFRSEYKDAIKSEDPNKAYQRIMPKIRGAQTQEENLRNVTSANRPNLFNGDIKSRMDAARQSTDMISSIDPEYSVGLLMNDLDYGLAEASQIVKPGSQNYKQLVNQIPNLREQIPSRMKGIPGAKLARSLEKKDDKWFKNTENKVEKFLSDKWDPEKDSLIALKAELLDKGLPEASFNSIVNKVFTEPEKDPRLSTFNRNEIAKLPQMLIPGFQEIFSNILNPAGWKAIKKRTAAELRGKK